MEEEPNKHIEQGIEPAFSVMAPTGRKWEVVDVIDAGMDAWPLASPDDPDAIRNQRRAAVELARVTSRYLIHSTLEEADPGAV